jgi:hypothetical protein
LLKYHIAVVYVSQGSKRQKLATHIKSRMKNVAAIVTDRGTTIVAKKKEGVVAAAAALLQLLKQ